VWTSSRSARKFLALVANVIKDFEQRNKWSFLIAAMPGRREIDVQELQKIMYVAPVVIRHYSACGAQNLDGESG
jgi:hypothetical protein